MSQIKEIEAKKAQEMLNSNDAVIIDVRGQEKFLNEHIEGAVNIPSEIMSEDLIKSLSTNKKVIISCTSGNRASNVCNAFKSLQSENTFLLKGGLNGWKASSLKTVSAKNKKSLEIERQIFILAGSLITIFNILGFTCSAAFFAVPAFIGAGLVFAGATGFCPMAKFLQKMPWNK